MAEKLAQGGGSVMVPLSCGGDELLVEGVMAVH